MVNLYLYIGHESSSALFLKLHAGKNHSSCTQRNGTALLEKSKSRKHSKCPSTGNGEVKHGIANAGILCYHEKETSISTGDRIDDSDEYFEWKLWSDTKKWITPCHFVNCITMIYDYIMDWGEDDRILRMIQKE